MVKFIKGSIFDSKCDLLIIPCNTYGGTTINVQEELLARNLPHNPKILQAGDVNFVQNISNFSNAPIVGFAASVDALTVTSNEEFISKIMQKILLYSQEHSINKINAPLLGTGAGKLSAKNHII